MNLSEMRDRFPIAAIRVAWPFFLVPAAKLPKAHRWPEGRHLTRTELAAIFAEDLKDHGH